MKRFIIFLLAFLFIVPTAASADIQFFESNIEINSTRSDFLTAMIFKEPPRDTMEYPLLYQIENFRASGNIRGDHCEANRKQWGTNIVCDFTEARGAGRTLELKYTTSDLTRTVDGKRHFTTDVNTPEKTEKMVIRARLAEGFVLAEEGESPFPPYTPQDGKSNSDGRQIYVIWTRDNVTLAGEGPDISITYERVLPETPGATPLILATGSVFLLILLVIAVIYRRRKEEEEEETPYKLLKDDEREVVEFIRVREGSVKQRDIVQHTDFSKAKVSRLVHDLEERDILEIEKEGRTNRVTLQEGE